MRGVFKNFPIVRFFLIAMLSCSAFSSAFAGDDFSDLIDTSINRLQSRYGILFKYKDFPQGSDQLKFSEITPDNYQLLYNFLKLFEEEINKYPPRFFKDQDVRGIGFVTHLFNGDITAQGVYNLGAHVMFFDISRFGHNKAQQRHSIHHEIFHMMFQEKGDFPSLKDEAWSAINDQNFSYGKQSKPLSQLNPFNPYAPNQLGFVTYYAMDSVREDQAEVFACLMQEQHRRLIEQWAVNDKFLAKKILAIKAFAEYYHPDMDEAYWANESSE